MDALSKPRPIDTGPPVPVRRRPLPDKTRRSLHSPLLIAQRKRQGAPAAAVCTSFSPIHVSHGTSAAAAPPATAASVSMEQKLELLFGPRSTAREGTPELRSTKSLARARSIVMRKAHQNATRRPKTASGHMRDRSAATATRSSPSGGGSGNQWQQRQHVVSGVCDGHADKQRVALQAQARAEQARAQQLQ